MDNHGHGKAPERKSFLSALISKWGRAPARHRVFICGGPDCCTREQGIQSHEHLMKKLTEAGLNKGAGRVQCEKTDCLGVCGNGPIAVVYPGEIWYQRMTLLRIDRLVREHFEQERPVQDFAFSPPPGARKPLP